MFNTIFHRLYGSVVGHKSLPLSFKSWTWAMSEGLFKLSFQDFTFRDNLANITYTVHKSEWLQNNKRFNLLIYHNISRSTLKTENYILNKS